MSHINKKRLKKLRCIIAKSNKRAIENNLYEYKSDIWNSDIITNDALLDNYIYKLFMVNCKTNLYKFDEIFTRKRYYTELMRPNVFARTNH
jgi:hypothetical protein